MTDLATSMLSYKGTWRERQSPVFGKFARLLCQLCCCGGLIIVAGLWLEGRAQSVVNALSAPPPMRLVSSEERSQLTRETDIKKRIRTSVELAEARLRLAEELSAVKSSEAATDQLSSYQSIIEDAFAALHARGKVENKERDLFKRLELAMRVHGVRIEAIRRLTPSEYAVHVKAVYEFTRRARTEALNSFYGDTVIRQTPGPVRATGNPPQNRPIDP